MGRTLQKHKRMGGLLHVARKGRVPPLCDDAAGAGQKILLKACGDAAADSRLVRIGHRLRGDPLPLQRRDTVERLRP